MCHPFHINQVVVSRTVGTLRPIVEFNFFDIADG
jgi:hypothetical protein